MKKFTVIIGSAIIFTLLAVSHAFGQTSLYSDVPMDHVNYDALDYLTDEQVIEGYSDGNYGPAKEINRAEFMKILMKPLMTDEQLNDPANTGCFTDVEDEWFAPYICYANDNGIVEGYPDGEFKPANNINFSEAAKIIANANNLDISNTPVEDEERWFQPFVESLDNASAVPLSIEYFDEKIKRDEMAEMIYRIETKNTEKASRSYKELNGENLISGESCKSLATLYKEQFAYNNYYYSEPIDFVLVDEDMAEAEEANLEPTSTLRQEAKTDSATAGSVEADAAAPAPAAADDYSSTNVQVAGVDEADIIKNDGQYIYIIKDSTIRIVEAYPAENLEELVSITLGEEDQSFYPVNMYVDGDTMTVIGNYNDYGPMPLAADSTLIKEPGIWQNYTKVYVLDISDRSNPKISREVQVSGNYRESRKVRGTVYLINTFYPNYYYQPYYEDLRGEDLLPRITDSANGEDQLAVDCGDVRIMPKPRNFEYIVAAAIPTETVDRPIDREVIMGGAQAIYASRKNLYVANTDWFGGFKRTPDDYSTALYKFNLGDGTIVYDQKGRVPGTVLNQFSMDEYQDNFRIATTKNSWQWDEDSTNNLYVLDSEMDIVGSVEGLAEGEQIYSVRFVGERAYMVTFERIDPLFVIGLSDPENPKVLGKLKIPGFSNYLHPYDENHLIGFGKEVDPGDNNLSDEEFNLWQQVQGMKIGLFDVTDPSKPKELFTEVIGDNGTSSPLLYDHKALLFDKEKELLAFPVSVFEYRDQYDCEEETYSTCPSECRKICVPSVCTFDNGIKVCTADCDGEASCIAPEFEYGQKVFEGAYVYDINLEEGFKLRGKIDHLNAEDALDLSETGWTDWNKQIQRLLYMGDNLYSVSRAVVKANDLNTLEELNEIELAGSSYDYPIIFEEPVAL
ncbi:hypothetical protein GF340_04050 [Candidatus Peregrinibacteria bacterium]|nr:hypothetical protein [Candidatus Peregrinibacteria bacterium]